MSHATAPWLRDGFLMFCFMVSNVVEDNRVQTC